jgi:hypothetical protein
MYFHPPNHPPSPIPPPRISALYQRARDHHYAVPFSRHLHDHHVHYHGHSRATGHLLARRNRPALCFENREGDGRLARRVLLAVRCVALATVPNGPTRRSEPFPPLFFTTEPQCPNVTPFPRTAPVSTSFSVSACLTFSAPPCSSSRPSSTRWSGSAPV